MLTPCIAQINSFGLSNFKILGPALLKFVLGQWLLGPVGLDRKRESGTLCSHSCQVLPQQRYCENRNAFCMIFLYNCFKILTEVIKGCV